LRPGVPFASVNDPRYEVLAKSAQSIERQIVKLLRITPENITDAAIEGYMEQLRSFVV
jgi:hypothetical protein